MLHFPFVSSGTLNAFPQIGTSSALAGPSDDTDLSESFVAIFKNDICHRCQFNTRANGLSAVAEYIEQFYNSRRTHATPGCRTPAQASTTTIAKLRQQPDNH